VVDSPSVAAAAAQMRSVVRSPDRCLRMEVLVLRTPRLSTSAGDTGQPTHAGHGSMTDAAPRGPLSLQSDRCSRVARNIRRGLGGRAQARTSVLVWISQGRISAARIRCDAAGPVRCRLVLRQKLGGARDREQQQRRCDHRRNDAPAPIGFALHSTGSATVPGFYCASSRSRDRRLSSLTCLRRKDQFRRAAR
jgi:hypothetical protein